MLRREHEPGVFAWLLATLSLALPWIGAGFCLCGCYSLARNEPAGGWLLAAGVMIILADVAIDLVWSHPAVSRSDQPDLNQRAAQLVGRVFIVEEPIDGGRGKVRVGDTLWVVEGPDAPSGTEVKVSSAKSTVLRVDRVA